MHRALLGLLLAIAVPAEAGPRATGPTGRRERTGPLRIPLPPSPLAPARAGQPTRAQWYRALLPAQRRYVDRFCSREENAFEPLCGGTPLVVVFDGRPVEFGPVGPFAVSPREVVWCAFPTSRTPWIARDLDGNGVIDTGAELFGSSTVLPSGELARNGFEALATLDANGDGTLGGDDPAFWSLVLWSDRNGDRRGTPDELVPLADHLETLELRSADVPRCDGRGNCEKERAPMRWRDARGVAHTGAVVDVHLRFLWSSESRRYGDLLDRELDLQR